MIVTLILILFTLFVARFFSMYTVVRVNNVSMLPTLKPGYFYPILRDKIPIENDVVVILLESKYIIKRVIHKYIGLCANDWDHKSNDPFFTKFWVEGDNGEHSYDSRMYGLVCLFEIIGILHTWKQAIKNTLIIWRNI